MLPGRKKRKDLQLEELENSGEFFKSKNVLEYQNKCLCSKIEDLERKLKEKSQYVNSLERRTDSLAEVFTLINLEIYNLNETTSKVITQNRIKSSVLSENMTTVEMLSNIFKDIQSNSNICLNSLTIHDQLKSLIDSVSSNVMNLINNVINTISFEKEVRNSIENKMHERLGENFKQEYISLKAKNEELQRDYMTLFESGKNSFKEHQLLKTKYTLLEESSRSKDNKIEELESINFNLTRKVNTNPALPYINFEKKMFNKMAESHDCICHICGSEAFNTAESRQNEEMAMNTHEKAPSDSNNDNVYTDLTAENESLKERLRQILEEFQRFKIENVLTEDRLVNSKPFKLLLSQAEQLLHLIDSLKEANSELQRQKNEIAKEKEADIKLIESKFNEKITELEKIILDQTSALERDRITIADSNLKLAAMENLLKIRENKDIDSIFHNYEQEKENILRQMESLRKQLKEYERKFDEEFKRNKNLEGYIDELEHKLSPDLKDVTLQVDKRLQKKIDQIKKYEAELKSEREYKETFISELEVNEKGLNEINKKIKALTNQLLGCNEKIAKMTNEKIKDMETIRRLDEERDTIEKRMNGLEEKLKMESELKCKMNADYTNLKEILYKVEQDLRIKDEDQEIFKNELLKLNKLIEQYKSSYEKSLAVIKELETISSKNAASYEQIRMEYKELCNIKNLDSSSLDKSITGMKQEIEGLVVENNKYKQMVKCNVCREKNKDTINLKCFHMVCKECIDYTFRSRNRICPICKTGITSSDLRSIFWD